MNNFEEMIAMNEMAEALKKNTCLLELKMSKCKITDHGLCYFSRFLPSNETLLILDISKNEINDSGLEDLSN